MAASLILRGREIVSERLESKERLHTHLNARADTQSFASRPDRAEDLRAGRQSGRQHRASKQWMSGGKETRVETS